ncbi:hypothetical protein R3P38DRAFT_2901733 [Favolaschia claudopus]|uniref:HRDC domain-containing protein n=1 Tax=Favolaschia claudopus TaxID=2862362 RepID=A0AAW0CL82_9AGAR
MRDDHSNNSPQSPTPCDERHGLMAGDSDIVCKLSKTTKPYANAQLEGKFRTSAQRPELAIRRSNNLEAARAALQDWRIKTFLAKYPLSCFTDVGIMPDQILESLALVRVQNVEEMESLSPSWMLARRHGTEVIELLNQVDRDHQGSA